MLNIKNVSLNIENKTILNNINLSIKENTVLVITGPNGSGKSSFAKTLMGINKPYKGNIILNNKDITNFTIDQIAREGISYSFQNPINFKGLKVIDLFKAVNKDFNVEIIKKYLSMVGICAKDYLNRDFNDNLSGGEKKRIEIAVILYKNGSVNIFDEPEAGIDLWSLDNLIKIFKNKNNNITIIISHQEKLLNIADEIVLLNDGKILKQGKRKEMISYLKQSSINKEGVFNE